MDSVERRRSYRTPVSDVFAICLGDHLAARYAVEELSRSGVCLSGKPLPVTTQLRVKLDLPGKESVVLDGTVLRSTALQEAKSRLAVGFSELTYNEEEILADFITDQVVNDLSPHVLVGTVVKSEARFLCRVLSRLGFVPEVARTPLEMLQRLGSSDRKVDLVVLGSRLFGTSSLEMAVFLSEYCPNVKRVFVGPSNWRTQKMAEKYTHAVVRKPWTEGDLKEAFGAAMVS